MSENATRKQHWVAAWLKPTYSANQYGVYFLGCLIFSLGACFFIQANLGTDPLDVFALGVLNHLPLTIGIAQGGFAALMLLIWALWNKKLPIVSPFFTFFFCGTLIDLGRHYAVVAEVPLSPYPMMLSGVLFCAYGSSLIIMSGIGIRAMDLLAITMVYKWKLPFWVWKTMLEVSLFVSGYLMGGPVGVGSVCFVVFVNLFIQPLMVLNAKTLNMKNHGLHAPGETAGLQPV